MNCFAYGEQVKTVISELPKISSIGEVIVFQNLILLLLLLCCEHLGQDWRAQFDYVG